MSDRSSRLTAHLAAGASLPFVWGERDCCLWVNDWIKAERGCDPGGELRGTYASAGECARLLNRHGGFLALIPTAMERAGLLATDAPRPGDVGIVPTGKDWMMAICLGERWALKAKDGLAVIPSSLFLAWSV